MTLPAALRHEQHNDKHQTKIQERMRNDWFYDPPMDWGPTPIPADSSPWEESYPSERAEDSINYWLDNMTAVKRGDEPESMDSFFDRYNKKYKV